MKDIVINGPGERMVDEYFIELSMVNDSTKQLSEANAQIGYFVTESSALCSVGVILNGKDILKDVLFEIPRSSQPTLRPLRIDKWVTASNIEQDNEIRFAANYWKPGDQASIGQLEACLLQIRLIRRTRHWDYTVAEWIFDGTSGPSAFTSRFVVDHPQWKANPASSQRAQRLATQIQDLINEIKAPTRSIEGASGNAQVATLPAILLSAYYARQNAVEAIDVTLAAIDDSTPHTFDVRTPFFAAVNCRHGIMGVEIAILGPPDFTVIERGTKLCLRDELAVRLPLSINLNSRSEKVRCRVRFTFSCQDDNSACTATVYNGFEWATEIVSSRTISLTKDQTENYDVEIEVSDALESVRKPENEAERAYTFLVKPL